MNDSRSEHEAVNANANASLKMDVPEKIDESCVGLSFDEPSEDGLTELQQFESDDLEPEDRMILGNELFTANLRKASLGFLQSAAKESNKRISEFENCKIMQDPVDNTMPLKAPVCRRWARRFGRNCIGLRRDRTPMQLVRITSQLYKINLIRQMIREQVADLRQRLIASTRTRKREIVRELIKRRSIKSFSRTIRTPKLATARMRLSRARAHRTARTRTSVACCTGPPGSSEDGDPEPGEAGPNSHKLEKIETANTRQGGSHV